MRNYFCKMGVTLLTLLVVLTAKHSSAYADGRGASSAPNIIYILADDLGYADLSCYGQEQFKTPNIDKLAERGMLFTDHYSGNTVCAPSRSTLMTGMHTGNTPIRGNGEVSPIGQEPIPAEFITMAEALKEAGYATGAFGKWGLGYPGSEGDPTNQGFDEFYGYNCQRNGHNYYPYYMFDGSTKIILEGNAGSKEEQYAPTLIHDRAMKFIEKSKDKPFFLYYPSVIPHAELFAPKEYMDKFEGKYEEPKPYKGADFGSKSYKAGGYGSQATPRAAFAAMVTLLDDQVGEIVAKVKELGLEDNTLIIFTSDNGPHLEGGADPQFFNSNGLFRGFKRDLYEGGIRAAMVAKWPNVIRPNSVSGHVSAFWDMLPTFCEVAGAEVPDGIDGISMLPTFAGDASQKKHEYLYWEFPSVGGRKAIRQGDWKLIQYNISSSKKSGGKELKTMLFDLSEDLGEENDLAAKYPERVEQMIELMSSAHSTPVYDRFEF